MSMKRKHDEGGDSPSVRSEKDARKEDEFKYGGFSLQHNTANEPKVPVEDGTIGSKEFFENYIAVRRPCIIDTLPPLSSKQSPSISFEQLVEVAGNKQVQVERRFATTEAFGQNRTASRQLLMSISDFLKHLEGKDGDLYYLSTQDTDSDDPFQVPCRQLLDSGYLAVSVPWTGNLVLHACNLVRFSTS